MLSSPEESRGHRMPPMKLLEHGQEPGEFGDNRGCKDKNAVGGGSDDGR